MSTKYFVWGEGVWRELDVASGRVSGWRRRARFVFVRRGRLLVARRRPVLRALEELAAGQPSAAADGPRLSHRSKSESRTKRKHEPPAAAPAPCAPPAPPAPCAPPAPPAAPPACEHHHCCAHRCNNDDQRPAGTRHIATQCGAGRSALSVNIKQEHNSTAAATAALDYSSAEEFVSTSARRPSLVARRKTEVNELFGKTPATKSPAAAADKKRAPVTTHAAEESGDERRERARNRPPTVVSDNTESTSADEPLQRSAPAAACKELIISEADVALLRGFVARTRPSALARFDADVAYRRLLFHAINPLVHVERCERMERLLSRERPLRTERQLGTERQGLARARPRRRPAPRSERSASADTDKENKDKHSSPNKVREPVSGMKKSPEKRPAASEPEQPTSARVTRLGVSERSNKLAKEMGMIKSPKTNRVASDPPRAKPERSTKKAAVARDAAARAPPASPGTLAARAPSGTPGTLAARAPPGTLGTLAARAPPGTLGTLAARAPPGPHVISKRASQPTAKEYSNLEDHAIVAWVSSGSRACLVSGNRLWRDLQEQYERLTGRVRSWHSLRNRYLRYILPALGALQLAPGAASRLRAAAATGAIKSKNRLAVRRHSAYHTPARGASSRRPRGGASSDDTAAAADDDATGPSSPKRRSLRSRAPESASYKEGSGNESASKAMPSGSKESGSKAGTSKASGSKVPGSKTGGSKEIDSKASGSKVPGSKTGGSKEIDSKASGSKETGSQAARSKEFSRAARSPRYSDVTRRFASRHRGGPSSSSAPQSSRSPSSRSPSPRSPSPALQPSSRSRRLFNPNNNM